MGLGWATQRRSRFLFSFHSIVAPKLKAPPQFFHLQNHDPSFLSLQKSEREKFREKEMFGRMRPSASSPDSLERPPSKIFKDDSFSIYEATLMKLKLGCSQHDYLSSPSEVAAERENNSVSASVPECSRYALSSPCVEGVKIEPNCTSASVSPNEEVMIDVDNPSVSNSPSSSDSQSRGVSNQQRSRNASVLYLFSKYKSSRHALSSSE